MKTENKKIPQWKIDAVKSLSGYLSEYGTVLLASIKNIPASQFQEISKKLRGKAIVKVPKKSITLRSFETSKNETIKQLEPKVEADVAVLFSNLDAFDLAAELINNKSPAKAKTGQIAPADVEVEAGPTELLPGPAITELGSVGLQVQIEKGKIHIKAPKVIVKEGEKIKENVADVMSKLDIKPFSVGFTPLAAADLKGNKVYFEIAIDQEKALKELLHAYSRALPFAVEIGVTNKETLPFLLSKANMHEKAIEQLLGKEEPKEEKKEETPQKNTQETKSEENQ